MIGEGPAGDALLGALEAIAPPGVRVGVLAIDERHLDDLFEGERQHVAGAVAKRRREFATGRALLRGLLGERVEIPVLPSRAPGMPTQVVASLAHDRAFAVATLGAATEVTALGIDVEPAGAMAPGVAALVLRPDEDLDPRVAFVLKEAAYKAWSGLGGPLLSFHDVRLRVSGSTFTASVHPFDVVLEGRWADAGGRHLALVAAGLATRPTPSA